MFERIRGFIRRHQRALGVTVAIAGGNNWGLELFVQEECAIEQTPCVLDASVRVRVCTQMLCVLGQPFPLAHPWQRLLR
jgi:hypothetical protein